MAPIRSHWIRHHYPVPTRTAEEWISLSTYKLTAPNIEPSQSRPRVSNNNPFTESVVATCRRCPSPQPTHSMTKSAGTAVSSTGRRSNGKTVTTWLSWLCAWRSTQWRRPGARAAGGGKPWSGTRPSQPGDQTPGVRAGQGGQNGLRQQPCDGHCPTRQPYRPVM